MRERNAKLVDRARQRRTALAESVPKPVKRVLGKTTARETRLEVRAPGLTLGDKLGAHIRQRVGFKLGKLAHHIVGVTVRFKDLSGPKGAKLYECRFRVSLAHGNIVVDVKDAALEAGFDVGIDATERAVRRLVEKRGG